ASRMAQLFAAAKPRFEPLWVSRAWGNCTATMLVLPSEDPLSTTCTSKETRVVAITDRRQAASSSRVFKLTIEIVTSCRRRWSESAGIAVGEACTPRPCAFDDRLE